MVAFGTLPQPLHEMIRCVLDRKVGRHGSTLAPEWIHSYHDTASGCTLDLRDDALRGAERPPIPATRLQEKLSCSPCAPGVSDSPRAHFATPSH